MSTETIRLIRDGEKGERGYGGGGRGRLFTYRYTVTTRMTPALRWAVMRAILMFHNCEGQSQKIVSTNHNFWRERRAEADSNRSPSAYQPSALPLGQTGSRNQWPDVDLIIASDATEFRSASGWHLSPSKDNSERAGEIGRRCIKRAVPRGVVLLTGCSHSHDGET